MRDVCGAQGRNNLAGGKISSSRVGTDPVLHSTQVLLCQFYNLRKVLQRWDCVEMILEETGILHAIERREEKKARIRSNGGTVHE